MGAVLRSHCRLPEEKAIARGDGGVGGEKTEEDAEGVVTDVAPLEGAAIEEVLGELEQEGEGS